MHKLAHYLLKPSGVSFLIVNKCDKNTYETEKVAKSRCSKTLPVFVGHHCIFRCSSAAALIC